MNENLIFICADDGSQMKLRSGKYNWFYACPKYDTKAHCTNRLSLVDAEQIIQICENPGTLYRFKNYDVLRVQEDNINYIYIRRLKNDNINFFPIRQDD